MNMGELKKQYFVEEMGSNKVMYSKKGDDQVVLWEGAIKKNDNESMEESQSQSSSSIGFDSSDGSDDDDVSSSSSSSSSNSSGPLYELGELMSQLPIKRGLSKFYNGKSQTFASLANVESLAKEDNHFSYSRRMKSCKSFGGNLHNHHRKFGPKPTITKRSKSPKSLFS